MAETENRQRDWADLAVNLYDRLTGRGAEITYEFDNMEVDVPSGAHSNPTYANWKINGMLKIRTSNTTH